MTEIAPISHHFLQHKTDLHAIREGFAAHYVGTPDAALFADALAPIDAAVIVLEREVADRAVERLSRVTRVLRDHFGDLLAHCYDEIPFANPGLIRALRRRWESDPRDTHLATRFDMVSTGSGLRAFEINCGNICGLPGKGSNEAHVAVYGELSAFESALSEQRLHYAGAPERYRDYLVDTLGVDTSRAPLVWISDHGDNTEVFERFGLRAVDVRFPRDRERLGERDGQLLLDGHPVDFAYLDLGADTFFALDDDDPLARAAHGKTTWISGTFESIFLCEKLVMTALSDPAVQRDMLDPADAAAVRESLVPTAVLGPHNVEQVVRDQSTQVVKPSGLQGGDGVLIGVDLAPADWEELVRGAAAARDHVVQPFLPPPRVEVITQHGGKHVRRDAFFNANPVFVDDAFVDWFGRYSFGHTVTWSRGGSCPVLVAGARESVPAAGVLA